MRFTSTTFPAPRPGRHSHQALVQSLPRIDSALLHQAREILLHHPLLSSPLQIFLTPSDPRTASRASSSSAIPEVFERLTFGLGQGFPGLEDAATLQLTIWKPMGGIEFLISAIELAREPLGRTYALRDRFLWCWLLAESVEILWV